MSQILNQTVLNAYHSQKLERKIYGFVTLSFLKRKGFQEEEIFAVSNMIQIGDIGCFYGNLNEKRRKKIKKTLMVLEEIKLFKNDPNRYISYCQQYVENTPIVILALFIEYQKNKQDNDLIPYIIKLCQNYLKQNAEDLYVRLIYCNVLQECYQYQKLEEVATKGKELATQQENSHLVKIFSNMLKKIQLYIDATHNDLENLDIPIGDLCRLASYYFALRMNQKAIACLEKIRTSSSLSTTMLKKLYMCYESVHDYDKCIMVIDEMLQREDCTEIQRMGAIKYKRRCTCYLDAFHNNDATIIEGIGNDWRCYYNYGEGHYTAGRYEKALAYYQKAFELYRNFGPLWFRIVSCYEHLEKYSEASKLLEEASLQPFMRDYQKKIMMKSKKNREFANAIKGEEVLLNPIYEKNCHIYIQFAKLYAKHGHYAWALLYAKVAYQYYMSTKDKRIIEYLRNLVVSYEIQTLIQIGNISFDAFFATGDFALLERIIKPYRKMPDLYEMVRQKLEAECKRRNLSLYF